MEKIQTPAGRSRRFKWLIAIGATAVLIAGALIVGALRLETVGRDKLAEAMREHYQSDLEWKQLRISLFPPVSVELEGVVFRQRGKTGVPPLITIRKVTGEAGIMGLLRSPKRVRSVKLEGLEIQIPPKDQNRSEAEQAKERATKPKSDRSPVMVERIVADGTTLRILPKDAWKEPLLFDIQQLTLQSVGVDRPMNFQAVLRNAKPPGLIRTNGRFGPWASDDPGDTPVAGDYTFQNADLGVFKGLSGTLSSTGRYEGALSRIVADGTTDVPDFTLDVAGNPVHLKTEYHAIIDGGNGDTLLQPVTAHFEKSTVVARGGVEGKPGQKGKTVALDVNVSDARIEDMMKLAVRSKQAGMTGSVSFQAKLVIPPGDRDIMEKLRLDARFGLASAKFTSFDMQQKVAKLSDRARGDAEGEPSPGSVASNFRGRFVSRDGVIRFSSLTFSVPGARIDLNGSYGLRSQDLDFQGTATMDAKISEMTTGVKSFFLKAIDPLFKRGNAGAVIPIQISGSREQPKFGLDVGRVLRRK